MRIGIAGRGFDELRPSMRDDAWCRVHCMRWSLDSLEEHLPDVTFELAMTFALTNGTLPTEDLPVRSFLD